MSFKNSISLKSFFATTLFSRNCFFPGIFWNFQKRILWKNHTFPKRTGLTFDITELCDSFGKKGTQQKRTFTPFESSSDFRLIEEHCVNVLALELYMKNLEF